MAKNKQYKFHPAANGYPMLKEGSEERSLLVESIRTNGLLNDIVLLDGMILDGRNRYECCGEAGVEPRFRDYDGDQSRQAIADYVRAQNSDRRHLTVQQRAMAIAFLADYIGELEAAAKERQRAGGGDKRSAAAKSGSVPQSVAEPVGEAGEVNEILAKQAGASRETVRKARNILATDREAAEKIRDGELKFQDVESAEKAKSHSSARAAENDALDKKPTPAAILAIKNSPLIVLSPAWYKPGGAAVHNDEIRDKGAWELANRLDPTGAFVVFRTMNLTRAIDRALQLCDRWKLARLDWTIPVAGMNRFGDYASDVLVIGTIGDPDIPKKLPTRADEVRCPAAGIMSLIRSMFAEFIADKGAENLAIEIGGEEEHKGFQLLSVEDLEAAAA